MVLRRQVQMARRGLQRKVYGNCAEETLCGSICLHATVNYSVLRQLVFIFVCTFLLSLASRFRSRQFRESFRDIAGMSVMEAKPDILRECRIKFLHTFQVRSRARN